MEGEAEDAHPIARAQHGFGGMNVGHVVNYKNTIYQNAGATKLWVAIGKENFDRQKHYMRILASRLCHISHEVAG